MKSSLIIQEAKEVKSFIEKNKSLPLTCTINGNIYSIYTTSYLFAKLLTTPKNNTINVVNTTNASTSYKGKINEKVLVNDYRNMIKRFVTYVEHNHKVPSYITTVKSETKVQYDLFVYCLCKIIVFYYNNFNNYPSYCIFNSSDIKNTITETLKATKTTTTSTPSVKKTTNTKKTTTTTNAKKATTTTNAKKATPTKCQNPYTSSPHYTSHGCNKLGQCTGYFCAPHSIHQAMKKFGITKYSEKTIAGWAGTTSSGTGHPGINTAIAKISKETGIKLSVKWKNFSDMGATTNERFANVAKLLCKDNTAVIWHIAYINGGNSTSGTHFGHYEYVDKINTNTKFIRALNSLGNKNPNGSYQGKLQDRTFDIQGYFARNTPGGQPALCIITKG